MASMDARSARKLQCVNRSAMGAVGDILLMQYKEEVKKFLQSPHRVSPGFMTMADVQHVEPTRRCKGRRGKGRCRGRVTLAACVQLCFRCMGQKKSDLYMDILREEEVAIQTMPEEKRDFWRWLHCHGPYPGYASVELGWI